MLDGYGMDTITMAGSLEAKLDAMKSVGFSQVMLMARDLVGHPGGVKAAVKAVQNSGLRPTGFQVLRDFEGLSGHLHSYKVDIAKSMLEMCAATGSKVLLACSSTSRHATDDLDLIAKDLKKLAMMAIPLGIKVAYEGLSWGRTINEFTSSWDVVCRADCPNLGIGIDSFHIFAAKTPLDAIEGIKKGVNIFINCDSPKRNKRINANTIPICFFLKKLVKTVAKSFCCSEDSVLVSFSEIGVANKLYNVIAVIRSPTIIIVYDHAFVLSPNSVSKYPPIMTIKPFPVNIERR